MVSHPTPRAETEIPRGRIQDIGKHLRPDLLSGFLVFLIALPLSLAIAKACGYPPIAGVFTAIVGGLVGVCLSNSELTIKGPAAGLIVIAIGCIESFKAEGYTDHEAYQLALGVGVAAGLLQILFGLVRSGVLGEFFPTSVVHGMLAAIGVIIISKQFPVMLGESNAGEPLELLRNIPSEIANLNPEIALIGCLSLVILFGMPLIKNKYLHIIPAPMVVICLAVPLGLYFDLDTHHSYSFGGYIYDIDSDMLVDVPDSLFEAVTFPNFAGLWTLNGWKWVIMFALIGSLESMLSAKAIDLLDPYRRRTSMNRDLIAVGVGNALAACIGGLPMISEIVRSKANIDNGARTRFANFYHAMFLFAFVALAPWLIHRIPLAALGAMLVYTGFRLAHPREFMHVYKTGREQFVVFVVTIMAVLATDLLVGIGIGIATKFAIHLFNYKPVRSLFITDFTIEEQDDDVLVVRILHAAVFTNWLSLKWLLCRLDRTKRIVLDLSETHLIDHTVMEKLHELEKEFAEDQRSLTIIGADEHDRFSEHPHSARTKSPAALAAAAPPEESASSLGSRANAGDGDGSCH
jgi:MFS superfamily sulfate permease-like transporter